MLDVQQVFARMQMVDVAKTWTTWREEVKDWVKLQAIVNRMYNQELVKAIESWSAYLREQQALLKLAGRMHNRPLSSGLTTWIDYAMRRHALKERLEFVLGSVSEIIGSWIQWRQYAKLHGRAMRRKARRQPNVDIDQLKVIDP